MHEVGSTDQPVAVLLVEDDANVGHLSRTFLVRAGYDVHLAANGHEAIALVADATNRIDAAIVDLGLPDMAGELIVQRLAASRPNCAIVVATGSYDSYREHQDSWLGKPYRMADLVTAVAAAIETHRAHCAPVDVGARSGRE